MLRQLGNERGAIVITPLARGTDTWYLACGLSIEEACEEAALHGAAVLDGIDPLAAQAPLRNVMADLRGDPVGLEELLDEAGLAVAPGPQNDHESRHGRATGQTG